jgi:hypothetical protein
MKERILAYRRRIDTLLESGTADGQTDWAQVLEEHLVQVSFFQHERLIHLIVTVCFALMTVISAVACVVSCYAPLLLLVLLLLVLLIPYVAHYYLLENEVQKMYKQYDEILARCRESRRDT